MLQAIYPRNSVNKQPVQEVRTDIITEFKRLELVSQVRIIDKVAYVEILQADTSIKFAHNATALLSLLQMYEIKHTSD
jgi:hypothetical protein